jgi:hypothetical protein
MSKQQKAAPSNSTSENANFNHALNRVLSVSRAEMQKRIARAKPEKSSLHARFSYIPARDGGRD